MPIYEFGEDIDTNKDSKEYAPSYITLLEKPIETIEEQRLEHATDAESLAKSRTLLNDLRTKHKPKPVSQEITEPSGSFLHRIHDEDAIVDVCVRSSKASERKPMMFHIRVEELDEDVLDEFEQEKEKKKAVPLLGVEVRFFGRVAAIGASVTIYPRVFLIRFFLDIFLSFFQHHWSFMETQLDRIEHEMHVIINEADFFRQRVSKKPKVFGQRST